MIRYLPFLLLLLFTTFATQVVAMSPDGCGAGECRDCHSIQKKEAEEILQNTDFKVLKADFAEVPGFFQIDVQKDDKSYPMYLDFSKQYLFAGQVFKINAEAREPQPKVERLTQQQYDAIDTSDALLVGDRLAEKKIIVFTDPECPYCKKLHPELHKVVKQDPNIAFLIKLYPLPSHPHSYEKSKAIVCAKSLELFEKSLAGENIPAPSCETDVVDKTLALVKEYGINSTPTLVLPDGTIAPGYRLAEDLVKLIKSVPVTSAKN